MRRGRVEQAAPPVDIYNRPATPFVAGFVGASNLVKGIVSGGELQFGGTAVADADHLADGSDAQAYIRPHDVLLTSSPAGRSFPVTVDRRTNLGWQSKLQLRLGDGQAIFAELPNDELNGIDEGQDVHASLRNAKVFSADAGEPPAGPGDVTTSAEGLHTSDEDEIPASRARND
jgi:ABC-type sulfate/molybdate transport systems ATPase subunit